MITQHGTAVTPTRSPETHDPLILSHCLEDAAKWWWGASLATKLAGFGGGLIGIFFHWNGSPFLLATGAVIAEVFQFRSDSIRGPAQWLKQHVEYHNFLGWALSESRLSDIVATCPNATRRRCLQKQRAEDPALYFASHEPPGMRRALENLMESAWYSKHLCRSMTIWCSTAVVVTVSVAIAALVLALNMSVTQSTNTAVAQVVTAVLVLLFSLGLVRFVIGFYRFGKAAAITDDSCAALLKEGARVDKIEVSRLLHEYQLARNSAPAIPTWAWKVREKVLNTLWGNHRRSLPPPSTTDAE